MNTGRREIRRRGEKIPTINSLYDFHLLIYFTRSKDNANGGNSKYVERRESRETEARLIEPQFIVNGDLSLCLANIESFPSYCSFHRLLQIPPPSLDRIYRDSFVRFVNSSSICFDISLRLASASRSALIRSYIT